jgi:hypothetical protein
MVALNQRSSRHPVAETGHQLYETPACAIQALLLYEPLPFRIWEPAAGRGAIARVLTSRGHRVICHDICAYEGADPGIQTPCDFLEWDEAPDGCTCIVTNPPFKDADDFVRHGLTMVDKVIVLLRLAALEGERRSDLIDYHLARLWIGKERLPTMHRDGWAGPKIAAAASPFAWFVFTKEIQRQGFVGRRISWR